MRRDFAGAAPAVDGKCSCRLTIQSGWSVTGDLGQPAAPSPMNFPNVIKI